MLTQCLCCDKLCCHRQLRFLVHIRTSVFSLKRCIGIRNIWIHGISPYVGAKKKTTSWIDFYDFQSCWDGQQTASEGMGAGFETGNTCSLGFWDIKQILNRPPDETVVQCACDSSHTNRRSRTLTDPPTRHPVSRSDKESTYTPTSSKHFHRKYRFPNLFTREKSQIQIS